MVLIGAGKERSARLFQGTELSNLGAFLDSALAAGAGGPSTLPQGNEG